MMKSMFATTATLAAFVLLIGCNSSDEAATSAATNASLSGAAYLLDAEPEGARTVLQAREAVKDKDEVVVVGRIGGSALPWIEGRAAFSIVDPTLTACTDIPGDTCQTPWDYCCDPAVASATALVKVVDSEGKVVSGDAKELLNVKELDTVVAHGTAHRDEEGNLTVLATGIYVKR